MKIAAIGDLHLTGNPKSVKLRALDWALTEAERQNADCIIGIGDLTATGTRKQTEFLFERIRKSRIPFFATPGNAELRSGENGEAAQTISVTDFPVVLADSSRDYPSDDASDELKSLPDNAGFLLGTHCPPQYWKHGKEVFEEACKRNAVTGVIAGHVHDDRENCMRGLDPDKASGGPPMFSIFEQTADGFWQRHDLVMPGVDPADWSEDGRKSFLNLLGVACLREPLETLKAAAEMRIPVVELRFGYPLEVTDDLMESITCWRHSGGRILSVHLPEIHPGNEASLEMFRKSVIFALTVNCDRVTVHVPRLISIEYDTKRYQIINEYRSLLMPLIAKNITVGIENLHTSKGKTADDQRNFGCTIEECRDFISALRESCGSDLIGFHLDIGHARNNAPISAVQNVSDYYNAEGLPINGFHFHQVAVREDGSFQNHAPIVGLYDKLISLSGYFIARRAGELPADAPVILEINTPGGGIESYKRIKALFDIGRDIFDPEFTVPEG